MQTTIRNGRRVAIVHGIRTPFIKSGTLLNDLSSQDLGKRVAVELINQSEIDPEEIDQVIFGTVVPDMKTANLARDIASGAGISKNVPAYTVSNGCASSIQALTNAAESIMVGNTDVALVGGTESISNTPILQSETFKRLMYDYYRNKNPLKKIEPSYKRHFRDVLLDSAGSETIPRGEQPIAYAEKIAREHNISRNDQDRFSQRSHYLSSQANEDGRLSKEIIRIFIPDQFSKSIKSDNGIQKDISLEYLSLLSPIYPKIYGTVTEGNSSPLSDGASALLLMSEDKARSLEYKPLGYLRSYAYADACPTEEDCTGLEYSIPTALKRAGLRLKDLDLLEMHESSACKVLANIHALSSKAIAEKKLGTSEPVGEIDMEKFNVMGGSIAIGNPISSTGIRLTITLLNELGRRCGNLGLVSIGEINGTGATLILERDL